MLNAVERSRHHRIITWALGVLLLVASPAHAQSPTDPQQGEAIFTVFVRSVPIGVERVGVSRTETGWLVTSTGQSGPPIDLNIRSLEIEYDETWRPRRLAIDSVRNNQVYTVETSFADSTATNTVQQGQDRMTDTAPVDPLTVVLWLAEKPETEPSP